MVFCKTGLSDLSGKMLSYGLRYLVNRASQSAINNLLFNTNVPKNRSTAVIPIIHRFWVCQSRLILAVSKPGSSAAAKLAAFNCSRCSAVFARWGFCNTCNRFFLNWNSTFRSDSVSNSFSNACFSFSDSRPLIYLSIVSSCSSKRPFFEFIVF